METDQVGHLQREILLAFWKVHILSHAAQKPVVGQWILQELRHHGYDVSPGTLYPMLSRMEKFGWLECVTASNHGSRSRKEYFLTAKGRRVLEIIRGLVDEMYREVVVGENNDTSK